MTRRVLNLSVSVALILAVGSTGAVHAGGPTRTSDSYTDTFVDDFILELCGITTFTTATEHWSLKEFADGSAILHVTRSFVSEHPLIPREKGAATTFIAPDGTRTVVGKPIHLIGPDGGVLILDAGRVEFGDELTVRGPHPSLDADLAPYYCP